MQFSLLFFSSTGEESPDDKYGLLRGCSRFADEHGFTAVWTPERHFHPFGGIFPNPSLMGVLLATTTTRIRIRAGSVVLPLHHPIRVAEEWSVVDNLSGGRVDVAFATGWHPDDFVLAPGHHGVRVEQTLDAIKTVQTLWQGGTFTGPNGSGEPTTVRIHPLPVQRGLPVWLTCTGRPERFTQSGELGYNVLTALIFLTMDELAQRIVCYREARRSAGHDCDTGKITLMLHTFIGDSVDEVRNAVREPMKAYLRSSVDLWGKDDKRLHKLRERADALEFAFERYFASSGLFGTVDTCADRVRRLEEIGIDEIACLIDFGTDHALIPDSLNKLNQLRQRFAD